MSYITTLRLVDSLGLFILADQLGCTSQTTRQTQPTLHDQIEETDFISRIIEFWMSGIQSKDRLIRSNRSGRYVYMVVKMSYTVLG